MNYKSLSLLPLVELVELVNQHRPGSVVHEVSEVPIRLLDQLVKHVPRVLLDHLHVSFFVLEEVDPNFEEATSIRK